jgi:DNA-binding response OmpR family regulator
MPELGRILVVEDDTVIREVLADALSDEGYEVRTAVEGREALDVLPTWQPDLVILDVMLPIMDGYTFLQERRRRDLAPGVPVLLLSGSRQALDPAMVAAGASLAIAKPFELDHLFASVGRLIEPARGSQGKT